MNIRQAFALTVKDYGVEKLALALRVNAATLQNKANPNCTTHCPTVKDLEDVTVLTGDSRIADAFARLAGGVFVKTSGFEGVSDTALLDLTTRMGKEFGEVCGELARDLADGNVDAHEVERLTLQVYELNQAGAELVARVRSMVRERKPLRVAK